ncbi:MAG: hypothetical protein GEV07_07790 [Streptosporangiales bacterium]|nr:hypothetical protein [Streptosporangiales bacterium]
MSSPDDTEGHPGDVTVLQAKPVLMSRTRLVLVVCGFLALDVLLGFVIKWWVGVILVIATVVQVPLLRKRAKRHADDLPSRLEVGADRITSVVVPRGDAYEIRRVDGDLLEVRDLNGEPHLHVVGPAGDNGSIALGRFDVEAAGRAAIAHGWPWQPRASNGVIQPSAPAAASAQSQPGCEIALRGGRTRSVPSNGALKALAVPVFALMFGLVPVSVVGKQYWGWPGWLSGTLIAAAVLVPVAALVGSGFLLVRLSTATVAVDSELVSVKYGSLSANAVDRSSIAAGEVGKRWVRLRNHQGRRLIWVPLRPKRAEVLGALRSYGWPISGD